MFQEIKNTIYKQLNEVIREVNYGCRVVENNNPSLYKDDEEGDW